MVELGVDFIDVVILSLPPSVDAEKNFKTVILLWQVRNFVYCIVLYTIQAWLS